MSKPNIIWICTDQQRADSLGCYGNPVARTPNIDSLAATGVRFARHITPMQICSPSRATMFTGLYPRHHRLIMNGMALPENAITLPSLLNNAGYATHSVGKLHLQPLLAPDEKQMPDSRAFWKRPEAEKWTGPYYGFETVDLLLGEADTAALAGHYANWLTTHYPDDKPLLEVTSAPEPPPDDLDEIWRSAIPVEHHYNSWITDCAVQYIERATSPFFLFVSYPDPHHPFAPPRSYANRYRPCDMPLPRVDDGELARMPSYYGELYPNDIGFRELYWTAREDQETGAMITTERISDASMRKAIAHTHAMIEMIDDGVGRLLQALEGKQIQQDTVVMFTSDHGELLGTHGLLHKGPPPYRQLTEISMLMSGPTLPSGTVVDQLTSHIDLAPTFLEIAGMDPARWAFDGLSLCALIGNEGAGESFRAFSFGEYHPSVRQDVYNQTIYNDRWRLTIYPNQPQWGELFDHRCDPNEHCNRYFDPALTPVRRSLEQLLVEHFPPQPGVDNEWLCKW